MNELLTYYRKFKFGEDNFHNLMKNRVKDVLLVSTFYDAFIFEQDGRLSEQIQGEYQQLNLSTAPRIYSAPTGEEALIKLKDKKFDLVITMMRIGEIGPDDLSKGVKDMYPETPVLLLINVQSDMIFLENNPEMLKYIDDIFIWKGDSKLFLAMIKSVEDKQNLDNDIKFGDIQLILLVEDSVSHYSMFLPLLYSEIVRQTQRLITEELNDITKRLRMRARPKVLLVHSYDDAYAIYEKYKDHLIAIIEVGFGDFSFRNNNGEEISRVRNISQFENQLVSISLESILYHAKRHNFSSWLFAHGEFEAARRIKKMKITDFANQEEIRTYLLKVFIDIRNKHTAGKILNFDPEVLDIDKTVIKLANGSLGGKGRGIAFLNSLLVAMEIDEQFPEVAVRIPKSFIIGTEEFDLFLENNMIDPDDIINYCDEDIQKIFLTGHLTKELRENIFYLMEKVDYPLAIRSSGLLEDSQSQPFAGIYKTFMISNNHKFKRKSIQDLMNAIKLVYASVINCRNSYWFRKICCRRK